VLADLYADTGDRRWLTLSHHFDHHAVLDPLARREDRLSGLHGNTQVPKLLGVLMRYVYAGDKSDGVAAEFFWDAVALHHSYATGGHGRDEYFGPPDELAERVDGRTDESCNVYNMLKMTRRLFAIRADIKYAEFEERALFNHVLGSIDPDNGRTCYMVPVGRGVRREYQGMFSDFTCCVGSGMESHGLHGDGIYYESGDRLWVNFYAPSTADWRSQGATITTATDFPEGEQVTIKLSLQRSKNLTLALRRPSWAGSGFSSTVNGKPVKDVSGPGAYVELKRNWKNGDTITLRLPKTLRLEPTPDNPGRVALMWGPLVLAGDLGAELRRGEMVTIPSFVTAGRSVSDWLHPVSGKPGVFHTVGVGRDDYNREKEIEFTPFYRLHRRSYALYWDVYSQAAWAQRMEKLAADQEEMRKLQAATLAFTQPGETENEKNFNPQSEDSSIDRVMGHSARRGKKWFSFDFPVDAAHPLAMIVTYNTEERTRRTFDILVDGERVGEQTIERSPPGSAAGHFFDVEYKIPENLIKEKRKVTVRFQAKGGNEIGAVCGIRLVRSDTQRQE
jgi:uncharacterized protein